MWQALKFTNVNQYWSVTISKYVMDSNGMTSQITRQQFTGDHSLGLIVSQTTPISDHTNPEHMST